MDEAAPDDLTAGWKADPRGEARRRYWDGTVWTSLVSDQGQHLAPNVRGVAIPLAERLVTHSRERLVVDDARIALYVDAFLEPLIVDRQHVRGVVVGTRVPSPPGLAWPEVAHGTQTPKPSTRLNVPNVMTTRSDQGKLVVVFRTPQAWPRVTTSTRLSHRRATRRALDGVRVRVADVDAARAALTRFGVIVCATIDDLLRRS